MLEVGSDEGLDQRSIDIRAIMQPHELTLVREAQLNYETSKPLNRLDAAY